MNETKQKKKNKVTVAGTLFLILFLLLAGGVTAWWMGALDRFEVFPPSPQVTPTPEPTPAPTPEPPPTPTPGPVFLARNGYFLSKDGFFRPEEPLTAGQAAEIFSRAGQTVSFDGEEGETMTEESLETMAASVSGPELARAAVSAVHGVGDETVTRAEAAVFFNRLFGLTASEEENVYFPDVAPGFWAFGDIQTAAASERDWSDGRLPSGFFRRDGHLYYVDENGYFLRNVYIGSLLFGPDGRYTSGSEELDGYVAGVLTALDDGTMSRDDLLYAAYTYVRDNFTYLRRHYYKIGDVGWQLDEALTMYSTGKGNCYCYAAAFWAAARQLGYDAKIVSGTYGVERAPHGWVEIWQDGERYTYDVEIEMVIRQKNQRPQSLYAMNDRVRQAHSYIESVITDDLVARETNTGLLPR